LQTGTHIVQIMTTSTASVRHADKASTTFIVAATSLGFALALIFYWPGNVSSDLIGVWLDATNAAITAPHGLLMSFVWRWLELLLPGPGLMLAVQLAMFWSALAVLFLHIRPTRLSVIVGLLILAVNPFVLSFSGSLLVDLFSGNVALLGYMILLGYHRPGPRFGILLLAAFGAFGLAGFARYQMWSVALVALAGIFLFDGLRGSLSAIASAG
jgi:hypothetical protein